MCKIMHNCAGHPCTLAREVCVCFGMKSWNIYTVINRKIQYLWLNVTQDLKAPCERQKQHSEQQGDKKTCNTGLSFLPFLLATLGSTLMTLSFIWASFQL